MIQSSFKFFLLVTGFTALASASTMNATVTGTCGFYQGSPSNVVYSESFSGTGSFCNGSFTDVSSIQVGDIFASTSHTFSGSAPVGDTEFVTINTTLSVTQQYLFTPTVPPTTPTGTVYLSTAILGGPDEGTAGGTCQQGVSLNNISNAPYLGASLVLPITFGQPVSITETASLTCNLTFPYNSFGGVFSETGSVRLSGAIASVFDATGKYVGPATYQTVTPEPAAVWLVAVFGLPLLAKRRNLSSK
jgi:hypothetical protein